PTADNIYLQGHGFNTGDSIRYRTTGTPIGGLANNGTYFVIRVDDNQLKLAASAANATAGTAIALTPNKTTGTATVHSLARCRAAPTGCSVRAACRCSSPHPRPTTARPRPPRAPPAASSA